MVLGRSGKLLPSESAGSPGLGTGEESFAHGALD